MTAIEEHFTGGLSPNRSDSSNLSNRASGSVLDEIYQWLKRFIVTPSEEDLMTLTLWIAHTWLVDSLPSTPRLQIDSLTPGSGKSTVLEHLGRLCLSSIHMASIASPALLARIIDKEMRTLLFDEVDRTLDPAGDQTKELLSIINSGYRKGASRPVLVPVKGGDWEAKEMGTYSPVALAGNAPKLPDDTRSRMIRIVLMPDVEGRAEESNWEDHAEAAAELKQRLEEWAGTVSVQVKALRPELPEGCIGRDRERWAPLLRVALVAGGQWPARADHLIRRDMAEIQLIRDEGLQSIPPAVQLMVDLQEIFDVARDRFIETRVIVGSLILNNPDMWSRDSPYGKDLTVQRLGRMLSSSWRIHSKQRPDGDRSRGYIRDDFSAGFRQVAGMLPNTSTGSNGTNGSPRGVHGSTDQAFLHINEFEREKVA